MVRAPLIWLGKADPVKSMEATRAEDLILVEIRELFALWREHLGIGKKTALEVAQEAKSFEDFHDLLLRTCGDRGTVSFKRLGAWLRRIKGRVVEDYRLKTEEGREGKHAQTFQLEDVRKTKHQDTDIEEII